MKSARKKTKATPKFIGRFNPAEAQALGRIFLKITGRSNFVHQFYKFIYSSKDTVFDSFRIPSLNFFSNSNFNDRFRATG